MELHSPLETVWRLKPETLRALHRLGLQTARDLLFHFPTYHMRAASTRSIAEIEPGESVTLFGTVSRVEIRRSFRGHIPLAEARLSDGTGTLKLMWLHQPYIGKTIAEGMMLRVEGKVSAAGKSKTLTMTNPRFEIVTPETLTIGGEDSLFGKDDERVLSAPVYPATRGVTSAWLEHHIKKLLNERLHESVGDPIPEEVLKKFSLPSLKVALVWMHGAKNEKDYEVARKRFAFDEIFYIQLLNYRERARYEREESFIITPEPKKLESFIDTFPFKLTKGQSRVIETILSDFKSNVPMSRLLEGDVGSGKTAIAAATTYAAVTTPPKDREYGHLQVAVMAPTEILAKQHFESFIEYFSDLPIEIGLITSSICKKFPSKISSTSSTDISRAQLLRWIKDGTISLVIGTHSLIQKAVEFQNLGYVIIDEQHRFGVRARQKLAHKSGPLPHFLSMTATPIPRTLALTLYGDLDLSVLDELPPGRKPVDTRLVLPNARDEMYEELRARLTRGEQAYVICPRISEPDPTQERALIAKNVDEETKRLEKTELKGFRIGKLHGKMKPTEKEAVMEAFASQKLDVLVATSVIEVGINVPNATAIVIEGAERFGLSQLHQLRGRVARSSKQAACFLVTGTSSERSIERLGSLVEAKTGFELAEKDLLMRGPGELSGVRQSGITDLGMEAIKNLKMVEAAREMAKILIATDPELTQNPLLKERVDDAARAFHYE